MTSAIPMTGEIVNYLQVVPEEMVTMTMPKSLRDKFLVMVQSGVFEAPTARVMINFHEGHIQSVNVDKRTYIHKDIPKTRTSQVPPP